MVDKVSSPKLTDLAESQRYPFLDDLLISKDVKRRLSSFLDLTVRGSKEVYLTPIGKNLDPMLILNKVDSLIESGKDQITDSLYQLELSNRSKFGPRSIAKPYSEREDDVKSYFENNDIRTSATVSLTNKGTLRPLSLETASKYLKPSTNSGLPYFTKKKAVIKRVLDNFNSILKERYPCILFTRTQEGNKSRTVWGFDIADTLNELTVYVPLLNEQKKLSWRSSLLGPDAVDLSISSLMSKALVNNTLKFLSVDFSKYDSTISYALQESSFNYIKNKFQKDYSKDISYIFERFNTIGILTPNGIMSGRHGVPSGSTFTNEVDSIAQYLLHESSGIESNGFQIQGDDGVYLLNDSQMKTLLAEFTSNGLNVNMDKSYQSSEYCVFLQRLYDKHYYKDNFIGGIYPIYRAINRIVYQERFSNFEDFDLAGVDYYSIRTITILENVKYHPLFKEFVKLVYDLDKYKLKFSGASVYKYRDLVNKGSGSGGFQYNQFGDRVEGIYDFEVVKLINSWNR